MHDPDLQQRLLADLHQFAVPRHARWDPLGLMAVRQALRERMGELGPLEEHRFGGGSEAGTNLILKLPGREPRRRPVLVGAHYDAPVAIDAESLRQLADALEQREWAVDQGSWAFLAGIDRALVQAGVVPAD